MTWLQCRRLMFGRLKAAANAVAGWLVALLLAGIRRCDRIAVSNVAGAFMRTIGPWLPEHRTGRDAAEIAHLDHICSGDPYKRTFIDYTPESIARFIALKNDGKPALVFAAHLANWELPAVIAASDGLDSVVLYRRPNLGAIADAVMALRKGIMGDLVASSMGAPVTLARALEQGRHVAMLVDQHYTRGIDVTFFGRTCKVNPLIAMLAREVECPIHGTRVIRLPGNRFRGEISDEVKPARDAQGRIDVRGTMQAITDVVEEWVREHPEQWLWVHRRWR